MKQKTLRTFYLLTLPPLFVFAIIILLFDPDYIGSALFAFGYSFSLVWWTPFVHELVHTKKYRYSFLRLSYVVTKQAIYQLKAENKPFTGILVRTLIPTLFIALLAFTLNVELRFYYTTLGVMLAEGVIFLVRRFIYQTEDKALG